MKIVEDAVERRLSREAWERVAEGSQEADGWLTEGAGKRALPVWASPRPESKYIYRGKSGKSNQPNEFATVLDHASKLI